MDAHNAPSAVCYRFADLSLDLGARRLTRAGRAIKLGKLSFELLRVLAESAPNVVTQRQCFEKVWQGRVVSPETLTQRVKLLRHALSDDSRSPKYIGVLWGQGYRLLPLVRAEVAGTRSRRSLAVLPFESLSSEPRDAQFAAGVHEEILSALCRVRELQVVARTSVMRYENLSRPVPEIASELGADQVMEGSIRYANRKVRISAQLIDGLSGTHLWADVYERELGDDFGIQADVARQIAGALKCESFSTANPRLS
jgi:TolB-like protein